MNKKRKPLENAIVLVELIHTIPSDMLLNIKKAVDLEILDRKYLKKKSWFARTLDKMRADTYGI